MWDAGSIWGTVLAASARGNHDLSAGRLVHHSCRGGVRVLLNQIARRVWRRVPLRGGLGRRILLWFLVLSLLPLFLSNTLGYVVTRRIIRDQVQRYLTAITEVEARHVAAELDRHQFSLDIVVAGNAFLSRNVRSLSRLRGETDRAASIRTALNDHLDRKLRELESLTELIVLDPDGNVIAATRRERIGDNWSVDGRLRLQRDGQFFVENGSASHHDAAGDHPHVEDEHEHDASSSDVSSADGVRRSDPEPRYRLASPIRDDEGASVGALAAIVSFDKLREFLHIAPHLAGDVHTYLVDRQGRPLFVSHVHAPIDYAAPLPSPVIDRQPGMVTRYVNYEGVEVLGTALTVPGVGWRYISEVSVASAFGQLRELGVLAAGLEAGFALLLVAVVWLVAGSIVAPLRGLVAAAERIRGGELGVVVDVRQHDELGDLGRTFNQMSTELRRSADRIQELHDQEMRRAAQLASVGELASGIAHEIKNPLVGVSSGVDLLAKRFGRDSDAAGIARQIRTQLARMEGAIRDLLSYARPKDPKLVRANPEQLVERVVPLIGSQADAAGVRIETRSRGSGGVLRIDPELITQALVNLALNAIQAMQAGGVLSVETTSTPDEIRISVSDTGPGISDDRLETVFRPFYTSKHEGTGLGLAITRGIVERHGGRLDVQSEMGKGTTFSLVFPSQAAEGSAS